jgi:hypothetical protein
MIPRAKISSANAPATGFRASAACEDDSMFVLPELCRVAAVVMMIAMAIRFENAIPTRVSIRMRLTSFFSFPGCFFSGFLSGSIRWSSADEKIGRDRRPENSDQRRQKRGIPLDFGDQEARERFAQRHFHCEQCNDVREQHQCQPFQDRDVALIFEEYLREHRDRAEDDDK